MTKQPLLQLPDEYREEIRALLTRARLLGEQITDILLDLDALFAHQLIIACLERLTPDERSVYEERVLAGAHPQELVRLLCLTPESLSEEINKLARKLRDDVAQEYLPPITP